MNESEQPSERKAAEPAGQTQDPQKPTRRRRGSSIWHEVSQLANRREARTIGARREQEVLLWLHAWRIIDAHVIAARWMAQSSAYRLLKRLVKKDCIQRVSSKAGVRAYMLTDEGAARIGALWAERWGKDLANVRPITNPSHIGERNIEHNLILQHVADAVLTLGTVARAAVIEIAESVADRAGFELPERYELKVYSSAQIGRHGFGWRIAQSLPDALAVVDWDTPAGHVRMRVALEVQQSNDTKRVRKLSCYARAIGLPRPWYKGAAQPLEDSAQAVDERAFRQEQVRIGEAGVDHDDQAVDGVVYFSTRPRELERVQDDWNDGLPAYERYIPRDRNGAPVAPPQWKPLAAAASPWEPWMEDRLRTVAFKELEKLYYR